MGDETVDQCQRGDGAYVQWALEVLADQSPAAGAYGNERWLRLAIQDVSALSAIRAAYAEFESTRELHELARAVRNILKATGDTHG